MKCMNCGAELSDSVYCPSCGCDVSVQKQAIVLSGLYYNQGLEKAQVRDLSGAIDQLKRSLKFNKANIPARNLLGLVYFETGEVVAALSEWVISKNMQPEDNVAVEYIANLQQDANRLDLINQTIKKYNIALENCHNGNEDAAMIQLKKILAQNPKLIKGYHLLALLYLKEENYEKARKLLKRAIRIDKTNTTTLRFLREVDERTGTQTSLEPRFRLWPGHAAPAQEAVDEDAAAAGVVVSGDPGREVIQPADYQKKKSGFHIVNLLVGAAIGACAMLFVFVPAKSREMTIKANEMQAEYASSKMEYEAEISRLEQQIEDSRVTVNTANTQIAEATDKAESYDYLVHGMYLNENVDYEPAAKLIFNVNPNYLSTAAKSIFMAHSYQLVDYLIPMYKASGADAFNNGDYAAAILKLEAGKELDPDNYVILNYLAHSYRLSGDTANSDLTFQLIIDTWPDTDRAAEAKNYLSNAEDPASDDVAEETAVANAAAQKAEQEEAKLAAEIENGDGA